MTVLTDDERHFLVEGLAGPRLELPDLRAHQLFEQRAADTPSGWPRAPRTQLELPPS